MDCKAVIISTCPQNHKVSRKCHDSAGAACRKCLAEARAKEKKRLREHELDQKREAKQLAYAAKLTELEAEIACQKRVLKDQADERDRETSLSQKKQDLANLKEKAREPHKATSLNSPTVSHAESVQMSPKTSAASQESSVPSHNDDLERKKAVSASPKKMDNSASSEKSAAREDWLWQKEFEGASNEALDTLISMTGLKCHNLLDAYYCSYSHFG